MAFLLGSSRAGSGRVMSEAVLIEDHLGRRRIRARACHGDVPTRCRMGRLHLQRLSAAAEAIPAGAGSWSRSSLLGSLPIRVGVAFRVAQPQVSLAAPAAQALPWSLASGVRRESN
jgi:hypothetical protein